MHKKMSEKFIYIYNILPKKVCGYFNFLSSEMTALFSGSSFDIFWRSSLEIQKI